MSKTKIIIATTKSWNIENSLSLKEKYNSSCDVEIITDKESLNFQKISEISPEYIFFPHWSWIIPKDIYNNFECIVFHMTDLPYGRGGSPMQNLIVNKIEETKISAIRVDAGLDTGKIYLKEKIYIGLGTAEELFLKISKVIFNKMIPLILEKDIEPYEQQGEVVSFKRRKPEESNLSQANLDNLNDVYDFIRMLDAEGYPQAFLKLGKYKISFSEVHQKKGKLVGRFELTDD